jgi:hypothetical protein
MGQTTWWATLHRWVVPEAFTADIFQPSRPSQSKRRVEVLEFDTCALRCETPVGLGVFLVAVGLPSSDLALEEPFVGHPTIEALGRENTQFGFCQVEPAAMFRRVMPFEPLDQTTRLIGRESFVK